MSLLFNSSTEQVNHGTGLELADPCTILQWVRPSTVTASSRQPCGQTVTGGQNRIMTSNSGGAGRLRFFVNCATTDGDAVSNNDLMVANVWQMVAFVYDTSLSLSNRIFLGDLTTLITEVAYSDQVDSIGAVVAATGGFIVGRAGNGGTPFEGDIAATIFYPSTGLTLGQIQAHQFRFYPQLAGCTLYTHYGFNGVGSQADWSGSGNAGTVTGATQSDHVPIGPMFGFDNVIPFPTAAAGTTAGLSGTSSDGLTETEIVNGGETIIITLTNDTWVATGGTFNGQRQNIIDGLDSAQSEGTGWNAEVRDKEVVGAVARTSDTVVTITLSAAAAYNVTANETITVTVPATALVTSGDAVVATPTIAVAADSGVIVPVFRYHYMIQQR